MKNFIKFLVEEEKPLTPEQEAEYDALIDKLSERMSMDEAVAEARKKMGLPPLKTVKKKGK